VDAVEDVLPRCYDVWARHTAACLVTALPQAMYMSDPTQRSSWVTIVIDMFWCWQQSAHAHQQATLCLGL